MNRTSLAVPVPTGPSLGLVPWLASKVNRSEAQARASVRLAKLADTIRPPGRMAVWLVPDRTRPVIRVQMTARAALGGKDTTALSATLVTVANHFLTLRIWTLVDPIPSCIRKVRANTSTAVTCEQAGAGTGGVASFSFV